MVTAVGGGSCTITGRLNDSYSVTVNIVVVVPLATPVVTLKNTDEGVVVSWGEIEGATGYNVYRRGTTGGYTRLAMLGSGVTSYVDKTAVDGTSYYYTVKALKGTTQSAYKDVLYIP